VVAKAAAVTATAPEAKTADECQACLNRLKYQDGRPLGGVAQAYKCSGCGIFYAGPSMYTSMDGSHQHNITYPAHGHGHWWDGVERIDHKHAIRQPDGRLWVLG